MTNCCKYPNVVKAGTHYYKRCAGYFVLGLLMMLLIITFPIGIILMGMSIYYSYKSIKHRNDMICKNCKKLV